MKTNLVWLEVGEGCCGGRRARFPESERGKKAAAVFCRPSSGLGNASLLFLAGMAAATLPLPSPPDAEDGVKGRGGDVHGFGSRGAPP